MFRWYARESTQWEEYPLDAIEVFECDCTEQWVRHRNLLNAGVPLLYQRLSIYDIDILSLRSKVFEWVAGIHASLNHGRGLVLHGGVGTGKSLSAALIAKAAFSLGVSVHFDIFSNMIDRFAKGWTDRSDREYFECQIVKPDLLVIDDIGREGRQGALSKSSNVAVGLISNLIRTRVQSALPTYITTNMTIRSLTDAYGVDVFSLLSESAETVTFEGTDFRGSNIARQRMQFEIANGLSRPILLFPFRIAQ